MAGSFLEVPPRQKTWLNGSCGPICGGTLGDPVWEIDLTHVSVLRFHLQQVD
jgi:hypothetical protein